MAKKIGAKKGARNKVWPVERRGVRTSNEEELWKNVLAECERIFLLLTGNPWDAKVVTLRPKDPLEAEAREILSRLRSIVKEAVTFVARLDVKAHRHPKTAITILRTFTPDLQRQKWLSEAPPKDPLDPRGQLVVLLDTYNFFALPSKPNRSGRFLSVREMAVISLLMGNKPSLNPATLDYTPASVIKLEASYIRQLLQRHGAKIPPELRGEAGEPGDEDGEGLE